MAQQHIAWKDVRRALEAASRGQRDGAGFNWSDAGKILAWVCVIGSAVFWIPVQLDLAQPIASWREWAIGVMNGAFMVVGPPVFAAPFVPRSRIRQLLLEINVLTIGQGVAFGVALYLVVYAYIILAAWWGGRPNVNETGLLHYQVLMGLIFTVGAPTLLIAAASVREADEEAERERRHQRQLDEWRRERQQQQNRMAMLALQHRNAVRLLKRGLAQLGGKELEELTGYLSRLDAEDARSLEQAEALREHVGVLTEIQQITGPTPELADHRDYMAMVADELAGPARHTPSPTHAPIVERVRERATATIDQVLYERARQAIDQPIWTRETVQAAIAVGRSKASDLIRSWIDAGLVFEHDDLKAHYSFTH